MRNTFGERLLCMASSGVSLGGALRNETAVGVFATVRAGIVFEATLRTVVFRAVVLRTTFSSMKNV